MLVKEITEYLESIFPIYLQEHYDNTGNQIIYSEDPISSILLSLDISIPVIEEAIEKNCNLIITHHPLLFRSIKNITANESRSDLIIKLIENRISLYAIHTNLDKVFYDKLGRVLGFPNIKLLNESTIDKVNQNQVGIGLQTKLKEPVQLKDLIMNVKEKLNLNYLIYSGNPETDISSIAVVNGSGGGMIESIIQDHDIDCIITGDVGYHHAKYAVDSSVSVIDAGHFGTEFILLTFLQEDIQDYLTKMRIKTDVNIHITEKEQNPLQVFTSYE